MKKDWILLGLNPFVQVFYSNIYVKYEDKAKEVI